MERVQFKVNGKQCSVGCEVDSDTTLLDYLRETLKLCGTKYMCLEGGCGACMITATKNNKDVPQAINSCLVSVTSCQEWDIKTIEFIGNRLKGYHPLQKVLADCHGSQCGYCTPGWIMAMYSLLQTKKPTMLEIENSFGSNICRCTGYRPILQAFKKFASDAHNSYEISDIEDLKICDKSGDVCSRSNCSELDWCMVSKNDILNEILHIELSDKRHWYRVHTLSDVFGIWHEKGTESYMLVAGNTGKGVYPILEYPNLLIDVTGISELKGFYVDQNLVIGAGNTLTDVMKIFKTVSATEYFNYLIGLNDHLQLVAHLAVRNLATIAGNLILKNQHPEFKSDIFIILETVGAQITIMTAIGQSETLTLQNFLKEDMKGKIIMNVLLPPLNESHKIVTFKIMPRAQNAHAIVNAGFLYKINENQNQVISCRIVYGGLSAKFNRSWKTERYLVGKSLFLNETLQDALEILENEIIVTENLPDPPVQSRKIIALGLFYKGLISLCPSTVLHPRYRSGTVKLHEKRPVSEGQQVFDTNPILWPLSKAIPKLDALIQCAGESEYTDDIQALSGEVYAAFVLTTVALGTIEKIDPSEALKEPGVIAFYSASDIPGVNSFTPPVNEFYLCNEELLCNGEVKFYNQPLGIIVAKSQKIANKATTLVKVSYSNVRNPVYDIKFAKNDPSKVTLLDSRDATMRGNDISKIIKGDNTVYGQYHFAMETLLCLTRPTEEGLQLFVTTQWIDTVQQVISRMLEIGHQRIDIYVRRLGGSFGLKMSRASQVAAACALVAYKLNRPCRFINTLSTNMRAVGKRLPCSTNFEIGVNNKGVIQYMNYELYSDNGYVLNEPFLNMTFESFTNCYRTDSWNYKAFNGLTDTPSNTWCRSPGSLEKIAMAELIMEQISYELNQDPIEVRLANLDPIFRDDINEILKTIKVNSDYAERLVSVEKFNSNNRWKKRGLRFSFLKWAPFGYPHLNIEGAFIMGVGYWTSENLVVDGQTGELLTNRTWDYWVPQARDIPQDFRIYFREKSFSRELIFGAKGTGEPATCMGIAVPIAMRQAVSAARLESGVPSTNWFPIDGPYTVDKIALSCATRIEDFKFY
ncbi:xanthine dehydrogenase-like [Vanessa tameamea]|uniref:Xanthine dehydrogenase-like n=1 Tax=Vanessa tameamea TaxID=334116 RepID=A0ABM4APK9_VANTA